MRRLLLTLALLVGLSVPTGAQPFGQNQTITVVDSGTACVTAPAACAIYALDSVTSSVSLSISGTWTGTLTFEGTNNDGIWTALLFTNAATGARTTTTTASGLFALGNAGVIKLRVRATAAVTGSALVTAARGNGLPVSAGLGGGDAATGGTVTAGTGTGGSFYAADGSAATPSYSFTSEPTLGFWRSSAGLVTLQGNLTATASVYGTTTVRAGTLFQGNNTGSSLNLNIANGVAVFQNLAATSGAELKVDALPTIGSGFGTSPTVTAGSTPFAGSVNVGTGGAATTGVLTFGGTAYPSAPFCTTGLSAGSVPTTYTATTTQLTLSTSTAWPASTLVTWQCISSK